MSESERQLLLPRTGRRGRDDANPFSFPGPGRRDYETLGVSPGGYSWHRKISEHSSRSVGQSTSESRYDTDDRELRNGMMYKMHHALCLE